MERRVLLAIFLSFLVLYAYQALVVKPVPKPVLAPAQQAETENPTAAPSASASPTPPGGSSVEATPPAKPAGQPLVSETAERDIRVETTDVVAVFTNRGGRLKSWRLKHYFDEKRQPQELIESKLASHPLPFTLRANDDA